MCFGLQERRGTAGYLGCVRARALAALVVPLFLVPAGACRGEPLVPPRAPVSPRDRVLPGADLRVAPPLTLGGASSVALGGVSLARSTGSTKTGKPEDAVKLHRVSRRNG